MSTAALAMIGLTATAAVPAQLAPAATDYLSHQRWTVLDGLAQQTVTDVLEASNGYLWLTTLGGLTRFDGVRFVNFQLDDTPALGTNQLFSLFQDEADRLFIGTLGRGVVVYDNNEFRRFEDGAPGGDVQDFVQDSNGVIWAAGRGISRLVEENGTERFQPVLDPAWLPEADIEDLLVTAAGELWAISDRGLLRLRNGAFEIVREDAFARAARAISVDAANRIWIVSTRGIGYLEDGRLTIVKELSEPVYSHAIDAQGQILAGTSSGLYVAGEDDSGKVRIRNISLRNDDQSLQSGVTALHVSRTGDVWIGTNSFGLLRLSTVPFREFEDPRGLRYGTVYTLVSARQGGVWLQGDNGWLAYGENGRFTVMDDESGFPADAGSQLVGSSSSGDIWLREDDELVRVSSANGRPFTAERYPLGNVQGLVEHHDGSLWFGGDAALVSFTDGVFRHHLIDDVDGPVMPHLVGKDGTLWFTAAGVVGGAKLDGDRLTSKLIGQGNDWLGSELRALHEDSSGALWLSTYGRGLIRIRDWQLALLGAQHGLIELSLGGMLEDDSGRLWINSNRGVFVESLANLNAAIDEQSTIVQRFLGTPEANGPLAARDSAGRMWFPTVRGLVVVDPERYSSPEGPPTVHIEQLQSGDQALMPAERIELPAGSQDLTVAYTGIWLHQPEHVQFRYRLWGYDNEWVQAGSRRQAYFTKVPPGEYVFEVTAGTAAGFFDDASASIAIAVPARFYQTTWFPAVVMLAVLALLFGLHRYRMASIERHAAALGREIENRKKAERERALMESSLMESSRLESVGRLAGGIAHDFNNVLTAVVGHAEQALATPTTDAESIKDNLEGVIECSDRAASLTRQLLAFSRQQVLRPSTISANDIIDGLQPMLMQLLPENIELVWQPEATLADIRVDPGQLEQVIMNLVLNARDAMPKGGRIIVATRTITFDDETSRDTQQQLSAGRYAEISVADTGSGMAPDVAARAFDPFFTTKGTNGTGLGLASVHGIVLQSGGQITLESTPSRGTTFHVYFPALATSAATRQLPARKPPRPQRDAPTGSEHILVCEDNAAIRTIIQRTLASCGYKVDVAASPEQALEMVREGQPLDLLISDIMLPGMNGQELSAAITHLRPFVRVLFISGYTDDVLNAESTGNAEFLQKPFRPSDLLEKVRQTLGRESDDAPGAGDRVKVVGQNTVASGRTAS
ncbi:MAG: response regulator [Woeseia sp.]|nr:response regulator [Woeseia sp.]